VEINNCSKFNLQSIVEIIIQTKANHCLQPDVASAGSQPDRGAGFVIGFSFNACAITRRAAEAFVGPAFGIDFWTKLD